MRADDVRFCITSKPRCPSVTTGLVSWPIPGGTMAPTLDEAMKRLEVAFGLLEASVSRRLEAEQRRGDLETELQLMQDDRARLAVELDGALTRLHRFEAATDDVTRRVRQAIGAVETVLAQAGELVTRGGLRMSQVTVTIAGQHLPDRLRGGRGGPSRRLGGRLRCQGRGDAGHLRRDRRHAPPRDGGDRTGRRAARGQASGSPRSKRRWRHSTASTPARDERLERIETRLAEGIQKAAERIEGLARSLNAAGQG